MNNKSASNKKLIAAVIAAVLAAPLAQAADFATEIYGRANVTVDYLDNGSESSTDVSSNSSRIGFRASTEIQPGLKGKMQIEQEVRFDNGNDTPSCTATPCSPNPNNRFGNRDTFLGLESDVAGGLRFGYFDTPLKVVRTTVDYFTDQIGDARNLTRVGTLFDNRFKNGAHYYTPTWMGLRADVDYSTNNGDEAIPPPKGNDAISGSVSYNANGLYAAVAYERYHGTEAKATRAAASYKFGDATVAALYQHATRPVSGSDTKVDTYGVGASYQISSVLLKAQDYMQRDDKANSDANMIVVGADYIMSKAFRLLFAYASTSNDDNATYTMAAGGHGDQVAVAKAGDTVSGFSAGFRYDF